MKSALVALTLITTVVLISGFAQAQPAARVRTIIAKLNANATTVTAQLADGAEFELKSLIGGALITIHLERGEHLESSIQSISETEAASLRELIENANQCQVELTFEQTQIVQAKPVCESR